MNTRRGLLRWDAAGHTLVELIVALFVASIAVGFIASAYVYCIRSWTTGREARETIEHARLLYERLDSRLASANGFVRFAPGRWALFAAERDTLPLVFQGDSPLAGSLRLHAGGSVTDFSLSPLALSVSPPAWECRFSYVGERGAVCSFAWRGVCSGAFTTSRTLPVPPLGASHGRLRWDTPPSSGG